MQTVMPAKKTARPDVSTALTEASATLRPPFRPVRWRVTMKSGKSTPTPNPSRTPRIGAKEATAKPWLIKPVMK